MSTALILLITIGGTVLVFAAIAVMLVLLNRANSKAETEALGRLQQELAVRGWTYAERDDQFIETYNSRHDTRSPLHPLTRPPQARSVRDVITGTHRGRPFLAATFQTKYRGNVSNESCIWVRLPAARPSISVMKTFALQSAVNETIGWDLRTGNQDFDRAFEVTTNNRQFALDVLAPQLAQFLLSTSRGYRGFWLQGDYIDALDRVSDHRDPQQLVPALDFRCDILDRIPEHVWA